MGKLFLAFLFLFISAFSFCQEKVKRNELSISLIEIAAPSFSFYSYQNKITPDFALNLFYKRHIKDRFYFRANQSYNKYQINNPFQGCTMGTGVIEKIDYRMITTNFGFEKRRSITKKVRIYYGIDLMSFQFQTKTKYSSEYPRIFGVNNNYGIGLQPFAGLSIYPTKRIVLAIESSFSLSYGKEFYKSLDANRKIINQYSPVYFSLNSMLLPLRSASIGWRF